MTQLFNLSKFNFVLLLLLWTISIAGLFIIPLSAPTPIHWNLMGEPDGFAPGWLSVMLPALIGTAVLGFIAWISRTISEQDLQAGRAGIERGATIILLVMAVVSLVIILNAMGQELHVPKIVALLIGAVLIALGDILPKSQPNSVSGIRLPHTLNNVDVWRITHRWAGRFFVVSGMILILFAVFVQQPTHLLIAILATVLAPIVASVVISFRVAGTKE